MKFILFIVLTAFSALVSCTKTTTEPNIAPPPPATDTSKPGKPDTVYLQKTEMYYHYDQSGTTIVDSTLTSWSYDNQRRITKSIINTFGHESKDTGYFSYSASKNVIRSVFYTNNVLISDNTDTYFLNASGKPDSLGTYQYFLAVNNGVETPEYYNHIRYYFYNSGGNETSEQYYSIDVNNIKTATNSARLTYKGSELDSIIYYDKGTINSINIFENGNVVDEKGFLPDGSLFSSSAFTYYDILSGGFLTFTSPWQNRQLTKSMTHNFPTMPASNVVEMHTYTFDSSNRVKTMTGVQNNVLSWRREYTY